MPSIKHRRLTRDMNTDARNETIKARRLGGASFRRIAKELRLSVGSIAGRCHRMGLCQPPAKLREKSRKLDDRIRVLAESGARNREIALELGLPITTISSQVGRMEIPDRRRKTPERTTIRVKRPEPRVVEVVPEPVVAPDPATAVAFTAAEGCRYALWGTDETELSRARLRGRDREGQLLRLPRCARLRAVRTPEGCVMEIGYWTPDEDRRLGQLVGKGLRDPQIAEALGRTASAVVQRRCANGLKLLRNVRPVKPRRPRMPPEKIAAICEAIEAGLTPTETSRRTGVSVGLIEYYSRREGAVSPNAKAGRDVRPIDGDLLDLSSGGMTNTEIARKLGLTVSTVRGRLMTLARRDAIAEGAA